MAVRSKAFIIGMMLVPVFMVISIALQRMSQNQADLEERRFAVIDATGVVFPSIAAVASGCDIDTVRWSSALYFASPHSFAAAICSMIACMATLTAGSGEIESLLENLLGGVERR